MDPFLVLRFEGETYTTKVHNGAGKHPKWHEVWVVTTEEESQEVVSIACYEEDTMSNDFVGACKVCVSELLANGGVDQWFTIEHEAKSAGSVHLRTEFK
jgi:Ca2+-dependent lipid-binding protein